MLIKIAEQLSSRKRGVELRIEVGGGCGRAIYSVDFVSVSEITQVRTRAWTVTYQECSACTVLLPPFRLSK